jgi:G3E family GTPase
MSDGRVTAAPPVTEDTRLRLTIIGGYLGSGKTTWLRHQLFEGVFGEAHIIVNEAAETPVDDTLLSAQASGMTMLAGGCACCTGKADLVVALRRLCDARTSLRAEERTQGQIILETSGLADPSAILDAIRQDGVLVHHIRVTEIIVLVDALNASDQLRTEYLGRAQIEAADRIIVTKADAVPDSILGRVAATAQTLNPAAQIMASTKGQFVPLQDFSTALPFDLPVIPGNEPVVPTIIDIGDDVDWATFSVWLSALLYARGADLVRVKGVFRTPAGPMLIQAVRKSVQPPELLPQEAAINQNKMIFIGRGYISDDLRRSLVFFAS